ncbi:MAG TPA: hypothetical protein VL970_10865 [Candidatus Acidoferrales bacterium]|nr:hypothetical protein [Candidatus Acidoferrales bacterium]
MTATISIFENVLLITFVALALISAVVGSLRRARTAAHRQLDLDVLARRLSFDDFHSRRDDDFAAGWGFLSPLAQGEDRFAFNILRGRYHDQSLFIFDYHFRTSSGKQRQEHYCTFLMLVFKEVFPQIRIQPESLGMKIADALGLGGDIKFESAAFAKLYGVRSADKKFAYDVCNTQMIEYLLANPGLRVEIQGPALLLAFEPQLPVSRIEFELQRLVEIRSRMPEYLFAQS